MGDAPLVQSLGDQEPCLDGPQSLDLSLQLLDDDPDEFEGSKVIPESIFPDDQCLQDISKDTSSTIICSPLKLSRSESNSDEDGISLPGLDNLDIENAISFFLQE